MDTKQERHTSWEVCRCFGPESTEQGGLWALFNGQIRKEWYNGMAENAEPSPVWEGVTTGHGASHEDEGTV